MRSADYTFRTVWRVAGTLGEVTSVLGDADALSRWWPTVYLRVTPVEEGAANGVGRALALHTKGWLPYTCLLYTSDAADEEDSVDLGGRRIIKKKKKKKIKNKRKT